MKVGVAVLGLHIAAVCAFVMTQGCVTTESQGSGRGAGARHKGPWKHEHKKKADSPQVAATDSFYQQGAGQEDAGSIYDPVIIESASTTPEPYIAPVSTANTESYIVQKGDVLSRLAADFNTTTKNLIALNNLSNPDVLYVGQELRVPAGGRSSSSSSAKSYSSVKKGGEYTIQKGDTLSGIAVAAGVSINDLRSLNNIKNDRIIAGDTLSIPAGGKVPTNTQKSTPKKADPASIEPAAAEPAPLAPEPGVAPVETTSMSVDAVMDHVVYPGETLDDISRQYGVSKSDIMRLNNLPDASAVKEGDRLRIPISE